MKTPVILFPNGSPNTYRGKLTKICIELDIKNTVLAILLIGYLEVSVEVDRPVLKILPVVPVLIFQYVGYSGNKIPGWCSEYL